MSALGTFLPEMSKPNFDWFVADCVAKLFFCWCFKNFNAMEKYFKILAGGIANRSVSHCVEP